MLQKLLCYLFGHKRWRVKSYTQSEVTPYCGRCGEWLGNWWEDPKKEEEK